MSHSWLHIFQEILLQLQAIRIDEEDTETVLLTQLYPVFLQERCPLSDGSGPPAATVSIFILQEKDKGSYSLVFNGCFV